MGMVVSILKRFPALISGGSAPFGWTVGGNALKPFAKPSAYEKKHLPQSETNLSTDPTPEAPRRRSWI